MLPKVEVMKRLHEYIAPHIIGPGYSFLKEVLLLQLFTIPKNDEPLWILIVGGTATAKTKIAVDIMEILGIPCYIGKNATEAGIRDKIIMSNNSVLFLDEFDKWDKKSRHVLLEPTATGFLTVTQSFSRRGYHAYEAHINVTALCNPKHGDLVEGIPIIDQLSFSKDFPLIARFHLIIPIFPVDSSLYPEIAVRMVKKEYDAERRARLREIIISAKEKNYNVKVSDEIARAVGHYVKRIKIRSTHPEIITPRLLEGMLSMLKARARICLRNKVNNEDLAYVQSIVDRCYGVGNTIY